MIVVDASAVLAFMKGEPGADRVEQELVQGAMCGAANWSEVAQKVRSAQRDWDLAASLLTAYSLSVEPVTEQDAEIAAQLWTPGSGLSLGDRLCLALARRAGVPALTADRRWTEAAVGGSDPQIIQLR